ncbi:oxygen-independent coproporphyrinogen III oxidase [Prevotella scopos JCM 17725]|uniref:Coproporphyrinogen-III oxidase n=1 Tax=Prevotella scopos JCM 17725 TaxID=1236518 RepID=A0AAX2F1W2_9BACT|nr:oxygen-independent coproporphyrinogen III oxidase [Prevotella scopos]ANR72047.1 oxygen-independent coproporphyrinogen III oxidase [Prevotella scopos JCM 17725]QUB45761.1 oxygen-independent coproporphyrinogen III oxidase [Prevotella scopos JCM 17725]SHF65441.1 oxygen-independent coproporphyrinogen-3 oxidase [Prevotella scopos JCM 17725]
MKQELIDKYNKSVPRYTSYPPANFFRPFDGEEYLKDVDESNEASEKNLSFYFHMPFCRRLCHYCGCNSYPMAKEGRIEEYVNALHKEIDLVAKHLDKRRRISQIHYSGGSPTAMPVRVLKELNEHLLSLFPLIEKPEIAIECHPGYLTARDWQGLLDARFNRFSLGVQDFNEEVLRLVNRTPSELPTEEIVAILRGARVSINMDFLFGLPLQTSRSFQQTIEHAVTIRPDRITTFSYGHCPWIFKRQMILEKAGLPSTEEKALMFQKAKDVLHEAGYHSIGLDHFVLPNDELLEALRSHRLHRNFQGYCTRRTTGQVYAFGVTGISQLEGAYAQNTKSIDKYISEISAGTLPIRKGYQLTPNERIAREVIERLMCNYHLDWTHLAEDLSVSVSEVKGAINFDLERLKEMERDGILRLTENTLEMTGEGNPFVRTVAATLDPMMVATDKKFSKPI